MIKVFYSDKQAVDQGDQGFTNGIIKSPSAQKPALIAEALKNFPNIEFVEPNPVTRDDLKLCHDPNYVDRIMDLQEDNGFGNRSKEVAESLLYTNGAQYDAAKTATTDNPTCALVSGFHHAGYDRWKGLGYFCTFNGLMVAASKLLREGIDNVIPMNVMILDCDNHWGNGTDNILENQFLKFGTTITHISFGKYFHAPKDAEKYLKWLEPKDLIHQALVSDKPDLIIYQAGVDVHVNDPYGGVLTTEQIYERDLRVFKFAKELNIPITWNLAGGYQIDEGGSCNKVIELHLNTFKACQEVYGE